MFVFVELAFFKRQRFHRHALFSDPSFCWRLPLRLKASSGAAVVIQLAESGEVRADRRGIAPLEMNWMREHFAALLAMHGSCECEAASSHPTASLAALAEDEISGEDSLDAARCSVYPAWTDDDTVELYVRAVEFQARPVSRFWSVQEIDKCYCRVELIDQAGGCSVPSRVDPAVEFTQLQKRLKSVSAIDDYGKTVLPTVSVVANTVLKVRLADVKDMVGVVFSAVRMTCEDILLLVRLQMDHEKKVSIIRRVQNRLSHNNGTGSEAMDLKRTVTDLTRKIRGLELQIVEMSAKVQFGKVLAEMERKQFHHVLVTVAVAKQQAKAARLKFYQVFNEMKARGFGRVLEEIAVAKRSAKANELTERLRLLQLEAHQAGIVLEALELPMAIPTTDTSAEGVSDDIPVAFAVPKECP